MTAQMEMEAHMANASAAWDRMMQARKEGNRRRENAAWREHQKETDAAARCRARANKWEVASNGFNG